MNAQLEEEQVRLRSELARARQELEDREVFHAQLETRLLECQRSNAQLQEQLRHYRGIAESSSWKLTAIWRYPAIGLRALMANPGLLPRKLRTGMRVLGAQGPDGLMNLFRQKLGLGESGSAMPASGASMGSEQLAERIVPLTLPSMGSAQLTICVWADQRHLHTFSCLQSLAQSHIPVPYRVLVVDLHGQGTVRAALDQVKGVEFVEAVGEQPTAFLSDFLLQQESELVLSLNNACQVDGSAIRELLAAMDENTAMLGGRLLSSEGRVLDMGGNLTRDGSLIRRWQGIEKDDTSVRYRRRVDFCPLDFCLLRSNRLRELLGNSRPDYLTTDYLAADWAARLRETGGLVTSLGLADATARPDEGLAADMQAVLHDRELFRRHHAFSEPRSGPKVLVVDAVMVTPDQDSGSLRMWYWLGILRDLDCQVVFLPSNAEDDGGYGDDLRRAGIEVLCQPRVFQVQDYLEQHAADYDIIVLSRLVVADRFMRLVRKCAPRARVVFDTVDLHFLRERREAELEDSAAKKKLAEQTRETELALMGQADLTYVVSTEEQLMLQREAPGLKVEVLSNIHRTHPTDTPFDQRRDMLFIGGFRHPPNVDAMLWFGRDIMPLLRERLSGFKLYVIGSNVSDEIRALAADDVEVTGFIEDVRPYFERCRLSVSPLRYGAGVKGKVNMSMAYGVPVVATEMSVEGMSLQNGQDVLVADKAEDFADAVVRAYSDADLWHRLSQGGLENIERHFSVATAREAVVNTLIGQQKTS